ncbi:MAG: sulfotransferase [Verrucomicrobiota bacterium]
MIQRIVSAHPGIKAILMLRHPVDRALSHAKKDLARNRQRRLSDVPVREFQSFFQGKGQRQMASYASIIDRWVRELASPDHLLLGHFEVLSERPEALLTSIHEFLGVRTGPRYFGRHLREQINPTASSSALPGDVIRFLEDLLSDEIVEFQMLTAKLRGSATVPLTPVDPDTRLQPCSEDSSEASGADTSLVLPS